MILRESSTYLIRALHALDCLILGGLLSALVLLYKVPWQPCYTILVGLSVFLGFLSFHSFQLYRTWRGHSLHQELITIFKAWATVVGMLLFLSFFFKVSEYFSRVVVLLWFALTPLLIFGVHLLVRLVLKRLRKKGWDRKTAVIVGAGELGFRVAEQIESTPWAGIAVRGFFDDRKTTQDIAATGKAVLGEIKSLPDFLRNHAVDYIYIALPMRAESKVLTILQECRTWGAQICLVPDLYLFKLFNARIESLGDMVLLNFNPDFGHKRLFDIIFSSLVLFMTLPVTLLIALIIKLQDGGPVFYGHPRITSTGKHFKCWKFRSMYVDADRRLGDILSRDPRAREEWGKTFKLKQDPRVTKFGRFLRATSMDELPQFVNVLKGEMSVVGARPIVHEEMDRYYRECAGLYCSMKPGITGPWQVGDRSDTKDYDRRVQLDTWYVLNHSLWIDIKIIVKTIYAIVTRRGAY